MIHKHLIPVLVCLSVGFFTQAFAQTPPTVDQVVSRLEKKYAQKEFTANFSQTSRLAALEMTEKASGSVMFSHPGKMRWEYKEPEKHLIITNGTLLWIFRPNENQVMTGSASQFFKSGAGGAFLSDITLIRANFDIRIKEITQNHIELDLTPKKESDEIASIVIRIAADTDEIIRVVTYNRYEDSNLFEFFDTQFEKIAPLQFEFDIPAGTNIIDME